MKYPSGIALIILGIFTLLLTAAFADAHPKADASFFKAIHMAEASGSLNPTDGDGGDSIGPLQIQRAYWIDATQYDKSIGGTYQDCRKLEYAKRVVRAYMKRYATKRRLGRDPTYQDLARIHNGGPNGYRRSSTLTYWRKSAFDPLR